MIQVIQRTILILFLFSGSKGACEKPLVESPFGAGRVNVSFGYGLYSFPKYYYDSQFKSFFGSLINISAVGPIHFRAEVGISPKVGLGLSLNYTYLHGEYLATTPYTLTDVTIISALVRGSYHIRKFKRFDPYISIGLGYKKIVSVVTSEEFDYETEIKPFLNNAAIRASEFPFGIEAVVGARYYFLKSLSIYTEIGMSQSLIQCGISLKI